MESNGRPHYVNSQLQWETTDLESIESMFYSENGYANFLLQDKNFTVLHLFKNLSFQVNSFSIYEW